MFTDTISSYHKEKEYTVNVSPIDDDVALAQCGNMHAFERLYHRNVGRVYALCLRMTADKDRADMLTQDVFVRVWEKIDSFRGESLFTTWLHRLTVNVILVDARSERRRFQRVKPEEDLTAFESPAQDAPPGLRMDLDEAIARLPEHARVVFLLHDVEGYKHHEIASMMGVEIGTTKSQLHRARKLLQKALRS